MLKRIPAMISLVIVTAAFGSHATRKTASAVNKWPWPDALDAVTAAPGNHTVLLQNERVRVLDVTIPPHSIEPLHAHRWPSVLYIDRAGEFRDFDAEGKVIFDSRSLKEPIQYPVTRWMDPQAPHAIENLGDKPIHLIRVELKQ